MSKKYKHFLGKHHTEESNLKNRLSHLGKPTNRIHEKSAVWVGDKIGYMGLHGWLRRWFPKSNSCEFCNSDKKLELANITGIYSREFINWKYLCRSCHMKLDYSRGLRKSNRK